jgi:hypothetical protein
MGIAVRGIATGYNFFAGYAEAAGKMIPGKDRVMKVMNYVAKQVEADGYKTYLGRTGDLAATVLDYYKCAEQYPTLKKFGDLGATLKTIISAFGFFAAIPKALKAIQTPVKTGENDSTGTELLERVSDIGTMLLGLADATKFWNKLSPSTVPTALTKAQSWIYIIAGTAVGAHYINAEYNKMYPASEEGEEKGSKVSFSHVVNLATSASYLFASAVALVGKFSNSPSLERYRFFAAVGTGVLPVVKEAYGAYAKA